MSTVSATEMQARAPATNPVAIIQAEASEVKAATDAESMVFGPRRFSVKKRSMCLALVVLFMVLFVVIVMAITQLMETNDSKESEQDSAFFTLQEMMENGIDADDHTAFYIAFDTFDTNNDGALDEAEFSSFFEREMLRFNFVCTRVL